MESWVQSWTASVPMRFCYFFQSICPNYCACHEKVMPGHTKCCTCHAKIISANLKIWSSKMQPLSGNQCPDLLAISDEHVSCTAKCIFADPLQMSQRLPSFLELLQNPRVLQNDQSAPNPSVFSTFDFEMCFAPERRALHFFDIATSTSTPKLRCFVHFDFEMCFAPQRRTLFGHLNFQKWSEPAVFLTVWLRNALRATTACNFSSLIWRHGSAHRRFSEPTLRPSGATNHWKKHSVSRLSHLFAHLRSSFFWDFLFFDLLFSLLCSSLTLPISAFHLSILSEVWLLNFLRKLQVLLLQQTAEIWSFDHFPTAELFAFLRPAFSDSHEQDPMGKALLSGLGTC